LLVVARKLETKENLSIFLASLAPGLLFGGGWLQSFATRISA